jgi:hypothetical protein
MLVLGGIIGFIVCFFLIALPLAAAMAAQLGVQLAVPIVGSAVAPLWTPTILAGVIVHILAVLICYVIVAVATPVVGAGPVAVAGPGAPPFPWQAWERLGRGGLIGINACANLVLFPYAAPWLVSWSSTLLAIALPVTGLLTIAAVPLCIINLFALDESFCADPVYEAVLGWTCWLAPTAWPATIVGVIFMIVDLLTGATFPPGFEFWTGSFVVHGGILYFPWNPPTAYNLGNILFVDPRLNARTPSVADPAIEAAGIRGRTADGLTFHETGHTLNVAAFGAWFHYIGAIHENVIPTPAPFFGAGTYPELLAEGHLRQSTRPWFPLWAPPAGPSGLTSNAPPTTAPSTVNGTPAGANTPSGFAFSPSPAAPIVIPSLGTLTLVGAGATDPDGYPLAAINPGTTPAIGTLWAFVPPFMPAGAAPTVALPNAANTTATADGGGDYQLAFAVTDGVEANIDAHLISVVQAVATVPPTGVRNTPIACNAAGSDAGTAGSLPGSGLPAPALTLLWDTVPAAPEASFDNPASATPNLTVTVAGDYVVRLTVTENFTGTGISHSVTAAITITNS